MTKKLTETLGMKSLEEILAETEIEEAEAEIEETEIAKEKLPVPSDAPTDLISTEQMKGQDHAKRMDDLYKETLDVARQIVDMGMNIDPSKAPRMFEVANQLFKTAQESANSKRDAELDLMKLIQNQQKLEMDRRRLAAELGDSESISGEVIMIEDRNKLLKMLRQQKEEEQKKQETREDDSE